MRRKRVSRVDCELLESRCMLSATPHPKPAPSFPTVTGYFTGSMSPAGGAPANVLLTVTSQKAGAFAGLALESGNVNAPFTGTVNKKDAVRLTFTGSSPKFVTKVTGTLAGEVLTGKFVTTAGHARTTGTISETRLLAGIFNTTGNVLVVQNPPTNLQTASWENDTQIPAFVEQQNFTLPQSINLDITATGTSPSTTDANLSPSQIAAGTAVNSYWLHFDAVGAPGVNSAVECSGSITLAEPIVGLIVLSDSLNATNAVLGIPGDLYPNGTQYGLELDPAGGGTSDKITLSPDRHTLTVDFRTSNSSDNLRILTLAP